MDHDLLVALRALADPNRLRVAGACAADPRSVSHLASELVMSEPAVQRHLERLVSAGLVQAVGGSASTPSDVRYALQVDAVHGLGRRLAAMEAETGLLPDGSQREGTVVSPAEARIIRGFFRDDRLTTIPGQEKKRLVVVRYLRDRCFAEDRPYPEKEVNQRLALFHPDVATLRRAMVDEGLMTREAGVYRRPAVGPA